MNLQMLESSDITASMGRPSEGVTARLVALMTDEEKQLFEKACGDRPASRMARKILADWARRELKREGRGE